MKNEKYREPLLTEVIDRTLLNKNNVEKKMSAKDEMSLAKDIKDIEFDMMQDLADSIKEDFLKERSEGQSFTNWLQTKPDSYFERLTLKEGGKVK